MPRPARRSRPSRPLYGVLADLARERLEERVTLARLSPAETEALVEVFGGTRPTRAVALAIQRETDGNPFFVQEVVRQLRSEGRTWPLAKCGGGGCQAESRGIGKRLSRLAKTPPAPGSRGVLGDGFSSRSLPPSGNSGLPDGCSTRRASRHARGGGRGYRSAILIRVRCTTA
jgi:hypothetical protein